jgi:hypothetical protein
MQCSQTVWKRAICSTASAKSAGKLFGDYVERSPCRCAFNVESPATMSLTKPVAGLYAESGVNSGGASSLIAAEEVMSPYPASNPNSTPSVSSPCRFLQNERSAERVACLGQGRDFRGKCCIGYTTNLHAMRSWTLHIHDGLASRNRPGQR